MTLSFEALYDDQAAYVVRSLRRLGVDEADTLDEAQNVFIALHRHLDAYDAERPLKPWVFGFCYRVAANYRRLTHHRHPHTDLPDTLLSNASSEREARRSDARRIVLAGLGGLDEVQRAVFCMYELDGFTAPEIARVLEVPVARVYAQVKTARRRFRAALVEKGFP